MAAILNSVLDVGLAGASMGWQCPGCGHCYSPSTAVCWHCPQQPVTSTGANHNTGALCDCEGDDDAEGTTSQTCKRFSCDC